MPGACFDEIQWNTVKIRNRKKAQHPQMKAERPTLKNGNYRIIGVFAFLVLTCIQACKRADSGAVVQKIDSLFRFYSPDKPGGQLAVSLDGRVIYSRAWGIADLENNVPLTTETLIEAGSVSKQFTAAAVLVLEQLGKLKLNDRVDQYIPDLPSYGEPVLIRHLIHHTSGLREWSDVAELGGWPLTLRVMDNKQVLGIICRQRRLNAPPGTVFSYSNSNYVLLALIVEKASGMSFADFTNRYLFTPAGMTHSQWRNDYGKVIPKRSQAYGLKDGAFRIAMPLHSIHGPGGLLTTAEDLLKWNAFYSTGKLGGKELLQRQTALDTLSNGDLNAYAAGLFIQHNVAKPTFYHGGATEGYRAKLICSPASGLSVAWLSNTSMLDTIGQDPAGSVFEMLAKSENTAPLPAQSTNIPIKVDRVKLEAYAGTYKSGHSDRDVAITLGPDGLVVSDTPLKAIGERRFRFYDIVLSFDGQGGLTVTPPSAEPMAYHLVDTVDALKWSHQYAGQYFSDEVGAAIEIHQVAGRLEAQLVSGARYPLESYFKDGFLIPAIKTDLVFKRNSKNDVEAFELNTLRTRGVRFDKVQTRN